MEYAFFDSRYTDQVITLLNLCFPKKHIQKHSFWWRHFDAYFSGRSLAAIAVDNNIVCAFVCFTPVNIACSTTAYPFYSCAIQATHPQYRRRGIVSHLTQMIENQHDQSTNYVGFSNAAGVKIDQCSQRIAYTIVGQLRTQYVFSLPYSSDVQLHEVQKLPSSFLTQHAVFSLVKNEKYLQWRYMKHPKNTYTYCAITHKNDIIGYIVYKHGMVKHEVKEILLHSYTPATVHAVVCAFARFSFLKAKLFVSYTYLPNNFWQQCFTVASFARSIPVYFTVKALRTQQDANNWMIVGGDIH